MIIPEARPATIISEVFLDQKPINCIDEYKYAPRRQSAVGSSAEGLGHIKFSSS